MGLRILFLTVLAITIESALKKLKMRRKGGADGLLAGHLKALGSCSYSVAKMYY